MSTLFDFALSLRESGLSTIPIKPDGSKAAALPSWKPYQTQLAKDGELRQWFGNGARPGIAIIGGKVSGNLEIMDFDAPELIAEWRELVEEAVSGLLDELPQVQTPKGGLHVFYRCATIAGNTKLAQGAEGKTLIETRGEGGYVVTIGSPAACHPLGKEYKLINGSLLEIPELRTEKRAILHDCARALNQRIKADPGPAKIADKSSGLRAGDDYNARGDSRADLERHGWKYLREDGEMGAIADWAGKLSGAILRISGILKLAEYAENLLDFDWRVDADTMGRAMEIGRYFIPHAQAAFAEMGADPLVEDAKHLLRWIERDQVEAFTKREAHRANMGRFKKVTEMEPVLELLEAHGYIRTRIRAAEPGKAGRKQSQLFEVNPLSNKADRIDGIDRIPPADRNSVNSVSSVKEVEFSHSTNGHYPTEAREVIEI